MEAHSSVLAWRIPRTEESDRPQSMQLPRVRHDGITNTHTHTHRVRHDGITNTHTHTHRVRHWSCRHVSCRR